MKCIQLSLDKEGTKDTLKLRRSGIVEIWNVIRRERVFIEWVISGSLRHNLRNNLKRYERHFL
jgi:hypothetical protein